mmetsp:Transcript_12647/g.18159  ORF Transcript_12647/g.18159 Transcript_12647/m.18159 type:complete len:80 (-) Transcript_12647:194-433(-)
MLSEQWKEKETEQNDDNESSSLLSASPFGAIIGTVVLVVVLFVLAQIPIGQENYGKYTAVKTTTTIDLGDLNTDAVKGL